MPKEIAEFIRSGLPRPRGISARYGGEEFADKAGYSSKHNGRNRVTIAS